MDNWSARLKGRMRELKMTQEMLANKMGITRGAITHYLSGRRTPSLQQFNKLAAVLKINPAWLQFGIEAAKTASPPYKREKGPGTKHCPLPLLSWEAVSNYEGTRHSSDHCKEQVPHFFTDQPHWYALRVVGDSMVAPAGARHSFHEGDMIIIDPHAPVKHGSYVIALLPRSKEATFKQYVIDGGIRYLRPLNPQYPLIQVNDSTYICGVVMVSIGAVNT